MISPIHFRHRQQERIFKRRAQQRQQLPLCCKRMFSRRYSVRSNPSANCFQLVMSRRRRRRHRVTIPSWPAHPYWRRHPIIVIIRCTMVIQTRGIRSRARERERDTGRKLWQSIYLFLSFGVFSPHRCVCIQSGFSFSVLVLSRQQKTTLARLLALCFLFSF